MPPARDDILGPYRLHDRVGMGGMAETFVASRIDAPQPLVCLKRVRAELATDDDFLRQLQAEARLTAALDHPHIVRVLDSGRDGDGHYLVLELVRGCDLRRLLDTSGALPEGEVLHVAQALAAALAAAHGAGIVHRDLSPSNVLISADGQVKLGDFGIARALGDPRHTRSGVVKGKYPYMAPEYVSSGQFEPRCDLYALGVLLFECLTLRRPYDGTTELQTLRNAATGNHRLLRASAPETSTELEALVHTLIAPSPTDRPYDADAVVDALRRIGASDAAAALLAERVARCAPDWTHHRASATRAQTRRLRPSSALAIALAVAALTAAAWLIR